MTTREVRKTIVSFIVQHLGLGNPAEVDLSASTMTASTLSVDHPTRPASAMADSMISEPPPSEAVLVEPLYVHTQRELEDMIREMAPPFEGKENEGNWLARDKGIQKLRRLLKGNAPTDFHVAFVAGIKAMMDNITKVTNTLRTTMSTNACQLVQELYKTLGSAMDPMTELAIQNFAKMSAATKQIAGKNANTSMEIILSHCTYNHRVLYHVCVTFQEKNVQTRCSAPSWLKVLMKRNASHRSHMEHGGGLEMIEKSLKKGLEDANPKVRENTRSAFWMYYQIWPEHGDKFLANVDDKMRIGLEKDSSNPNKSSMSSSVSSLAGSKTQSSEAGRRSIRDAIAAQRRAAAKTLPDRPNSAQSILSQTSASSRPARAGPRPPSAFSTSTSGAQAQPSRTLNAAPVRRPARRPELTRPATADPYASRQLPTAKQSTPTISPHTSPSKVATASRSAASRTVTKTPAQASRLTAASVARNRARTDATTRPSPHRSLLGSNIPSSPNRDENLTLVTPFTKPPDDDVTQSAPVRHVRDGSNASANSIPELAEGDSHFTMVLPNLHGDPERRSSSRPSSSHSPKSHIPLRSPPKLPADKTRSPLQRFRTSPPKTSTPSRLTDITNFPEDAPVQVYEDPFTTHEPATSAVLTKPVLEEIPVNERISDVEQDTNANLAQSTRSNEQNTPMRPTARHTKTTSTGSILGNGDSDTMQTSAESIRSRRLLVSGIERIRNKTLDAHGFRRVQDIVKNNAGPDIWGEENQKFGELLLALLEYLEAPAEVLKVPGATGALEAGGAKMQNLKSQVIATVRAMLAIHKREAAPYYPRALCSVLATRRQFDAMSHITADMEKLVAEIVQNGRADDCLDAVLDLVDSVDSPHSPGSGAGSPPSSVVGEGANRTVTASLNALSALLPKVNPSQSQIQRLGELAARFLSDTDPEVRRAEVEFCIVLHGKLGGSVQAPKVDAKNGIKSSSSGSDVFWKTLAGAGAPQAGLNLIMYYLAKERRA
jgi:CLIP-associating protein 1/2